MVFSPTCCRKQRMSIEQPCCFSITCLLTIAHPGNSNGSGTVPTSNEPGGLQRLKTQAIVVEDLLESLRGDEITRYCRDKRETHHALTTSHRLGRRDVPSLFWEAYGTVLG